MEENLKQLLLKDLCARLPYRPKFRNPHFIDVTNTFVSIEPDYSEDITSGEVIVNNKYTLNEVKPYLRPMNSMTDEEKLDLEWYYRNSSFDSKDIGHCVDYFNKKHLDYRGLIPMGLAIEAPEGMYNTKQ